MIAKVRIAPIEHWCTQGLRQVERRNLRPAAIIGKEIRIHTETRAILNDENLFRNPESCSGAYWDIEKESGKELAQAFGLVDHGGIFVVCEHMLEMD